MARHYREKSNLGKIIILIVLILIIIVGLLLKHFVFYDKHQIPKGAQISILKDKKINVFEDVKLQDIVDMENTNVEITSENFSINTRATGNMGCYFTYKYKGIREFEYNIEYTVVDEVNPIFIFVPKTTETYYVGDGSVEAVNKLKEKISYGDNYDINPTLEFRGSVEFEEVGNYPVELVLTDSSGNQSIKDFTIRVIERPVIEEKEEEEIEEEEEEKQEEEPEEEKFIAFENQIENYKTDHTMVGIDVSKWQGEVDFNKVKEAGAEFVILRLGVMKDKDSELVKDKTFEINYSNAKKAGLKVGIYVYSEANNVNTAISNAQFVIDTLAGEKLDFPVAFDWESWKYFPEMDMNIHMLNEMYDAFSEKLKESGYDTMLYASQNYLNNVWMDLKDYKIWVAKYSENYPEIESNNNKFLLWQNSSIGRIDGIEGDVDLDIYFYK